MKRNRLVLMLLLLAFAIGWLVHPADGVPILAYHKVSDEDEVYSVSPKQFEAHMQYLREHGYTAISLQEMSDAFAGRRTLPPHPVVITFDDGYEDNLLTALPIMERYGMKATIFVIAGSVGQPEYLTWEQLEQLHRHDIEIGSHTLNHTDLKQASSAQRQEELTASKAMLEAKLHTPVEFLAYPFGQHDTAIFAQLQQAGYRGACTGIAGVNFSSDPPYRWKRVNLPRPKLGMLEFRLRLLRAQLVSW